MQTLNNPAIEDAKAEYVRAQQRLEKCLATTPDERIHWAPSSTARTPLQIVAHAALSVSGIQGMLDGQPFPWTSIDEADKEFRRLDKQYETREKALALLSENSESYLRWLDSLTSDQIESTVRMGPGEFPMTSAVTFAADHMRSHASQIDYIQTVYGDMDWHLGF